jgi:hypothetical protein
MSSNNLAINAKKSNFIIFGNGEIPDLNVMFDFDNKIITSVQKVKYLGVRIDHQLKFRDHLDFIIKKCSAIIGFSL